MLLIESSVPCLVLLNYYTFLNSLYLAHCFLVRWTTKVCSLHLLSSLIHLSFRNMRALVLFVKTLIERRWREHFSLWCLPLIHWLYVFQIHLLHITPFIIVIVKNSQLAIIRLLLIVVIISTSCLSICILLFQYDIIELIYNLINGHFICVPHTCWSN